VRAPEKGRALADFGLILAPGISWTMMRRAEPLDDHMDETPTAKQQYRVTADYQTQYPDPIVMRAGDPLQVGQADADNPAWVWCTGPDGRSGWVPRAYFARDGAAGRALRDYEATELNVRVGEVLTGGEEESGWV
jgi:hypothetical protein